MQGCPALKPCDRPDLHLDLQEKPAHKSREAPAGHTDSSSCPSGWTQLMGTFFTGPDTPTVTKTLP